MDKSKLLKPENVMSAAFVLILAAAMTVFILNDKPRGLNVKAGSSQTVQTDVTAGNLSTATAQNAENTFAPKTISVYVVGSVVNPGVYSLTKGKLIFDAISAAGGLTTDADALSVNMAFALTGNAMIYVKSVSGGQPAGPEGIISSGVGLVADAGGGGGMVKVNINTADAAALMTLPGVGESTAADIIAYRASGGIFEKIEDIMKVPGIKDSKFQKLKDFICVE